MASSSFADLRGKRDAKEIDGRSSVAHVSHSSDLLYKELDHRVVEIRHTQSAGRSLFAKRRIAPGTVIAKAKPHVAILDKAHLHLLCSHCMLEQAGHPESAAPPLKRCSACKSVHYCSAQCQRSDWKPEGHKLECARLRAWAELARAAGRPASDHVPDTPIRALGKLILLKAHNHEIWWREVEAMADSPRRLSMEEQEQIGSLALAVTEYLGGPSTVQTLLPTLADPKQMTRFLLALVDKFGINSFSLTSPDLSNIGVAICPVAALVNHECKPNCAIVFPQGPSKDLHVVAFSPIEEGSEILSSYVDLTLPVEQRQEELAKQYKFECACPVCSEERASTSRRAAIRCIRSDCRGLVPIPDMRRTDEIAEIPCETCSTIRTVQLAQDAAGRPGLRFALETASKVLSSQRSEDFAAEDLSQQEAFVSLVRLLSEVHQVLPSSHPLLALNRLSLDRSLDLGVKVYDTRRYERARWYALQVMVGLENLLPTNHPVRAVQRTVVARLCGIGPDGEELMADRGLILAYEQLKRAREEVEVAFGRRGILLDRVSDELRAFERDLQMRRRLQGATA